ncbi:YoaK family protein [Arenimonas sp.]|uniref:YoaK family protein n=1 Tax=Arenimonas sp. TaxID=1872635 RepID=UPI0035ADC236
MAERLATWVWVGAAALAFVAGMVNVVGYLGFEHQAITHLTGTTTLLGAALAGGETGAAMQLAGMVLAFVAGAAFSGLLIQDSVLRLGRRYGVALTLEALLLVAAVPLFQRGLFAGPLLAAGAIGLQNAMATTYSGAVVRTSHVSGMFTDLGIMLGHALRGLPLARRRLWLCLVIISAFLAGGVVGALAFERVDYSALYLPAALTGGTGLAYALWRRRGA